MQLSPRRKALRVIGVTLSIIGIIIFLYTIFVMQEIHWYDNPGPEPGDIEFDHRTFQAIIGFVGVIFMLLGFSTYRFMPSSEREI